MPRYKRIEKVIVYGYQGFARRPTKKIIYAPNLGEVKHVNVGVQTDDGHGVGQCLGNIKVLLKQYQTGHFDETQEARTDLHMDLAAVREQLHRVEALNSFLSDLATEYRLQWISEYRRAEQLSHQFSLGHCQCEAVEGISQARWDSSSPPRQGQDMLFSWSDQLIN